MAMDQRPDDLKPGRLDTYKEWQAAQNIPVIAGFFVKDINEVELAPWDLKGGNAAFVVLDGTGGVNDAQIVEIAPGGKLKAQKHLYEEMVYVTKGVGATTVWQKDGNKKHTFEWGPGSLFAIPLNARYQHFNASGTDTARYFSVTNCCFMINLFHATDFVFENDWEFLDRFDPRSEGYFSGKGEVFGRFFMTTNFVPDTHTIGLADYKERGKGSTNMKFDLAKNT
ncbi:MAG: cupin domain-containing protein, partial [Candidatus Binatia bacterium]